MSHRVERAKTPFRRPGVHEIPAIGFGRAIALEHDHGHVDSLDPALDAREHPVPHLARVCEPIFQSDVRVLHWPDETMRDRVRSALAVRRRFHTRAYSRAAA